MDPTFHKPHAYLVLETNCQYSTLYTEKGVGKLENFGSIYGLLSLFSMFAIYLRKMRSRKFIIHFWQFLHSVPFLVKIVH